MTVALLALAFAVGSGAPKANADELLIREAESLRDSLALGDSSRPALTLRLPDLHFYEAPEIEKTPTLSGKDQARAAAHRRRALMLYREAESSDARGGSELSSQLKLKIRFQIARLYADLGETGEARRL